MSSLNISLPDSVREFVDAQVEAGGYSTANEYICELVRMAEQVMAERVLEEKLLEGIHRGEGRVMTKGDWDSLRATVRGRLEGRNPS